MAYNKQRTAGFKNGKPLGASKPKSGGFTRRDEERTANDRPKYNGASASRGKSAYDNKRTTGDFKRTTDEAKKPSGDYKRPAQNERPRREKPIDEQAQTALQPVANPVDENELPLIIYGRNPVKEALKSGRSIDRILVVPATAEDGSLREIIRMARDANVIVTETTRAKLDELTMPFGYSGKPGNHQGIVARIPEVQYVDVEDILDVARAKNEPPFVVVLDSISDPHNLGSIIRTAVCAGAHGVIIPKRRAASVTASAAKASAGAVAYMQIARVANLTSAVEKLKDAGLWVVGADANGTPMGDVPFKGAIALVIGGEDEGISRLLREKCDFIASIPMSGEINSLNASVAAAILMYEKLRQDKA